MAERGNLFLKKTFVAVTGASKGLGRSIALQFSSKFPPGSVILMMARNIQALENVKTTIMSSATNRTVLTMQYDQGNEENKDYFRSIFSNILQEEHLSPDDFEQFMIVHNCATVGNIAKTALELSDSDEVRQYYNTNLTGMILLNTSFFSTFLDSTKSRVIVNVTFERSIMPAMSMHLYSAGKAARDMFFRVLAIEEPFIRILTFSPGACDTDALKTVEENSSSEALSTMLKDLRKDGKIPSPDESIRGLVKLLEENSFENAAYVDSYMETLAPYQEKLDKEMKSGKSGK